MIRTTIGILPDKMIGMIAFLSMVEKPYRNKIFAMSDRLKITKPWQFRRFSYSKLMTTGKAGQKTMINLRIALVRCGCPFYPDDTVETLERLLNSTIRVTGCAAVCAIRVDPLVSRFYWRENEAETL